MNVLSSVWTRDSMRILINDSMAMHNKANTMASCFEFMYYSIEIFHIWRALLFTDIVPFQSIEAPKCETQLIESGNGSL